MRTHAYTGPLQGVPDITIQRLDPRAMLPEQPEEDMGLDVFAFLLTESGRATSRAVHQKAVTEVPTGLTVRPPPGYYVQINSRLTLARAGVFVANAPAIIPHRTHQTELIIWLFNGSHQTMYVAHEHRIARLTLHPITQFGIRELPAPKHPEDVHP